VSEYSDLQPTPEELADVDAVLDEVEALEELGMLDDDPDGEGFGPWDDQAAQLADLNATLDASAASEQLRLSYDGLPLPRTSEERFAQALGRIAEGSYTPGTMYRPPEPSHGCGTVDEYGRCSARYHTSPTCMEADSSAAAAGGGEATEAWVRTLLRNQETASALSDASAALDDVPPGGPADPVAYEAIREHLGVL
jgi:hypothetical protein